MFKDLMPATKRTVFICLTGAFIASLYYSQWALAGVALGAMVHAVKPDGD